MITYGNIFSALPQQLITAVCRPSLAVLPSPLLETREKHPGSRAESVHIGVTLVSKFVPETTTQRNFSLTGRRRGKE